MSHTAVLFAGGYSRRMGRGKTGLAWGDRRLLEHQADTLRAADPQELILSCRPEQPFTLPGFARVDDGERDSSGFRTYRRNLLDRAWTEGDVRDDLHKSAEYAISTPTIWAR